MTQKTFTDALTHPNGYLTISLQTPCKADGLFLIGSIAIETIPPYWYCYGLQIKVNAVTLTPANQANAPLTYITPMQLPYQTFTQYQLTWI